MQQILAVVLGYGGYNDMGLIRSGGEAGYEVALVSPSDSIMPIHKSRYVKYWLDSRAHTAAEVLNAINRIHADNPNRQLVVFPASDMFAVCLDEIREQVAEFAVVPNAKGNLRYLMDKANMVELAGKAGLNVPASHRYDLNVDTPNFNGSCIIKPLRSISGDKGDITICRTPEALSRAIKHYREKESYDVLIQSLIEGPNQSEIAVTGVSLANGEVITRGIIHKIRIRGNGSTVFARYKDDLDRDLECRVKSFIKATGYTGIFDIEFLENDNGRFFIECNFRNGAYGYAVTRAGFNMPGAICGASAGIPFEESQLREVTFMEERSDILNVYEKRITAWHWLKDVMRTNVFLWSNLRDPKPLLRVPHLIKKLI